MALNITVQTYCGRIDFGLIACREAMPDDLNDLGTAIEGGSTSWSHWRRCAPRSTANVLARLAH